MVHVLSHFQLPATQLERGWVNTNAMSIIDAPARRLLNTVLLDDVDLGAALPWGVATSGDGKTIFVTHAGTHELSRIDASALLEKLTQLSSRRGGRSAQRPVALWPRCASACSLPGNGPRGVAVVGDRVYAAEYFADTLGGGRSEVARPESGRSKLPWGRSRN